MALNDGTLTIGATAMRDAITHFQLHSAAPDAGYTTNTVGSRLASTGTVDADGDITWSNLNFTGLPANTPVTHVSYWSAATGGTNRGGGALAGDTSANSAGEFSITSITENGTAS